MHACVCVYVCLCVCVRAPVCVDKCRSVPSLRQTSCASLKPSSELHPHCHYPSQSATLFPLGYYETFPFPLLISDLAPIPICPSHSARLMVPHTGLDASRDSHTCGLYSLADVLHLCHPKLLPALQTGPLPSSVPEQCPHCPPRPCSCFACPRKAPP